MSRLIIAPSVGRPERTRGMDREEVSSTREEGGVVECGQNNLVFERLTVRPYCGARVKRRSKGRVMSEYEPPMLKSSIIATPKRG